MLAISWPGGALLGSVDRLEVVEPRRWRGITVKSCMMLDDTRWRSSSLLGWVCDAVALASDYPRGEWS